MLFQLERYMVPLVFDVSENCRGKMFSSWSKKKNVMRVPLVLGLRRFRRAHSQDSTPLAQRMPVRNQPCEGRRTQCGGFAVTYALPPKMVTHVDAPEFNIGQLETNPPETVEGWVRTGACGANKTCCRSCDLTKAFRVATSFHARRRDTLNRKEPTVVN